MLIFPSSFSPKRSSFNLNNTYRVRQAQLGGGYKQISPAGINNVDQKVSLEFIAEGADQINELLTFFNLAKGATPFIWTCPYHNPAYWTCPSVNIAALRDDLFSFKCEFQSFNQLVQPSTLIPVEENTALTIN